MINVITYKLCIKQHSLLKTDNTKTNSNSTFNKMPINKVYSNQTHKNIIYIIFLKISLLFKCKHIYTHAIYIYQ